MKRILIPFSFIVLLCHTSCHSEKKELELQTQFLATSPLKMDTSMTKKYVCQIHSLRHIELRSQERGYLQHIYVDEGEFVKEGQLLFQIMPKIYQAEYEKSKAEAKVAEIEYQNTKSLADRDVVSQNELAMSKAKYEKAQAELSLTKAHLGFTAIRAPFDGIVNRFHVRPGSLVEEGELLTTLSDNSKMWVYFNVSEAEYLEYITTVKEDSTLKVSLLMANNKMFKYTGIVETIEAEFNNETGNIAFRATFPNPDGLLRHGQTGNIILNVPLNNALVIPQKASFEILDKKYVFVIDGDNTIKSKEITVGAAIEDLYIVSNGLTEEDKILLEGLRKVQNKDKISYKFQEPMAVISGLELPTE